jgi:hypothetical protein
VGKRKEKKRAGVKGDDDVGEGKGNKSDGREGDEEESG